MAKKIPAKAKTTKPKGFKAPVKAKKKPPEKQTKQKPPKIIGDLRSDSPEAKAIYKNRFYHKNHKETLKKQKEYDARHAAKKVQEFLDYYDNTYPLNDE
jgi:hypothetical protein